jgi:hypothetical protein
MIKLKSLNKKLLKLEASLQKDAKKLAKLKRKVEAALRAESAPATMKPLARTVETSESAAVPAKKKRELTPAGRAKLSALMKARWATKRTGAAGNGQPPRVGVSLSSSSFPESAMERN